MRNNIGLYRAKRIDNGEWVKGNYIFDNEKHLILQYFSEIKNCLTPTNAKMYPVDPETIGQYTGLKDKNGKMIFEGDIVEMIGSLYVVKYLEEMCSFMLIKTNDTENLYDPLTLQEFKVKGIKIIGNSIDKPELLKGDK